jgi:hypothetical protein
MARTDYSALEESAKKILCIENIKKNSQIAYPIT